MSSMHEQKSQAPAFSWWRCIRFPLIVLVVCGTIFAIPLVCVAFHVNTGKAEDFLGIDAARVPDYFMMMVYLAPALAVVLIGPWWLFFSGLRFLTRLAGVILVAVAVTGFFYFSIRDVEMTMSPVGLVPRFHFKWEPSGQDRTTEYENQESAKNDDLPAIDATVGPEDFPSYRGLKRDGMVTFAKLQTDWDKTPPKELWKRPCGIGYSGIAVAGNIAVTLEQRKKPDGDGEQEAVVCYDRATGRKRWAFPYEAFYKDESRMGNGPRSTPTIHNGRIFSIGATGKLVCLNAEGKEQWTANVLDDAKATNIKWGLTGSPLIVDDLVVAHAGVDPINPSGSALIAYEQATGKIRWRAGYRKAGYSSPHLAVFGDTPQILLFDAAGLISYDKAGKELWQHPWVTDWDMNSIQPLVLGNDRVFISSEMSNGCAMLRVKAPEKDKASWSVEVLWENKLLAARYANPVSDGKHIFGLHHTGGVLTCLNASDGTLKWKGERCGPGQMLLVQADERGRQDVRARDDDVLLVVNGKDGYVSLFETDSQSCNELARLDVFKDKTWNTPALAGYELFVRNQTDIACFKLPRR